MEMVWGVCCCPFGQLCPKSWEGECCIPNGKQCRLWRRRIKASVSKSGLLCSSGKAESSPRTWCFSLEVIFLCFASFLRWDAFGKAGMRREASEWLSAISSSLQEEWSEMVKVVLPICFREPGYLPFCCHGNQWPLSVWHSEVTLQGITAQFFFQGESPSYWFNLGPFLRGF